MTNIRLPKDANIPNMEFKVVQKDNILLENIQEQSLKELSSNKCNSTIIKTEIKRSSIQLAVCSHGNFVIKFVFNAKLHSCPAEVLANVAPADVTIGNNSDLFYMLSINFNLKQ